MLNLPQPLKKILDTGSVGGTTLQALFVVVVLVACACSSKASSDKSSSDKPHRYVRASGSELSPRCRAVAFHRLGHDPTEDDLRKLEANFVVTFDFTTRAARSYQCPVDWLDLQVGPHQRHIDSPKENWPAPLPSEIQRCDQQKIAEACFDIAMVLKMTDDPKPFFEKACDFGLAVGCLVLAQGPNERVWRERALDAYERGCRAGKADACEDGAYILREGKGVPKDIVAAMARFGR